MASITRFKGGAELQRALNELPVKLERNVMRSALRAGAVVLRNEARKNVPEETGALKKSIKVSTRARKGVVTATLKAGDEKAFYAHMLEYGTAPHDIAPKSKKALTLEDGGVVKHAKHPGIAPRPFMRPALDEKTDEAVQAVTDKIRTTLATKHGINVPQPAPDDD